jgi:hypothetical protein
MKFATLIDPALQTDVYADSPWIFSPILCSMNTVNVVKSAKPILGAAPSVQRKKQDNKENETSYITPIAGPDLNFQIEPKACISSLTSMLPPGVSAEAMLDRWKWEGGFNELKEDSSLLLGEIVSFCPTSWSERRKNFQKPKAREATVLSPNNIYNFEVSRYLFNIDLCAIYKLKHHGSFSGNQFKYHAVFEQAAATNDGKKLIYWEISVCYRVQSR